MLSSADQSPEDLYWGAFYLSRILSANLGLLAAQAGVTIGRVRIRRGDELEVHASAKKTRIGFALAAEGPLRLFVAVGRARVERAVPAEASEAQTGAILRRLLARAG